VCTYLAMMVSGTGVGECLDAIANLPPPLLPNAFARCGHPPCHQSAQGARPAEAPGSKSAATRGGTAGRLRQAPLHIMPIRYETIVKGGLWGLHLRFGARRRGLAANGAVFTP
jgi:hypothetical protein